jgi:hypothetical protein
LVNHAVYILLPYRRKHGSCWRCMMPPHESLQAISPMPSTYSSHQRTVLFRSGGSIRSLSHQHSSKRIDIEIVCQARCSISFYLVCILYPPLFLCVVPPFHQHILNMPLLCKIIQPLRAHLPPLQVVGSRGWVCPDFSSRTKQFANHAARAGNNSAASIIGLLLW